jgi:hypothetical protein
VLALNLWNKKTIDNSRGDNDENNRLVPNVFFQGSSTLDKTKDTNVQQQPKRTTKTFFLFFEWVARTHTSLYSYLIQVSRLNVLELFYLYYHGLAHRGKMNCRPYTNTRPKVKVSPHCIGFLDGYDLYSRLLVWSKPESFFKKFWSLRPAHRLMAAGPLVLSLYIPTFFFFFLSFVMECR